MQSPIMVGPSPLKNSGCATDVLQAQHIGNRHVDPCHCITKSCGHFSLGQTEHLNFDKNG